MDGMGRRGGNSAVATLRQALEGLAEVRGPDEAEEPILAPNTRRAVADWLFEIGARDALKEVGLRPRTSSMLYGPPGCGKTTLAHHMGSRLGIPLVLIGAESVFGSMMGESEKNAAAIFDAIAKAKTACILFIDEFDAIGKKRGDDFGSATRDSVVTVLLRKIEAYQGLLMAATNRREAIDPALWRRFHMQIGVDLPGDDERFAILKRYGGPFEWDEDDIGLLADLTQHASPALLRGLMEGVKRALVLAPRRGRDAGDAPALFASVMASLDPPEGMERPPLWGEGALADLTAFKAWPPQLKAP